jgi:superfamily I DNA/RNA helicase
VSYRDLTQDQRAAIADLPFDGNHLLSGPPGSGKSILAAHRAVMLSLTGTPVVVLTHSNLLRQSLAPLVHRSGGTVPQVTVTTAHKWLAEWYGPKPPCDGHWFDWPAFYERAADAETQGAGPTLVVDEGQDLPPEFYRLCRLLDARVTVFADECQRLTEAHSTLAEIAKGLGRCTRAELDGNHRNTYEIAALAAHFHTGVVQPALPEREGPVPRLHRFHHRGAADLLITLAEQNPRKSIGVVVNSPFTQFSLLGSIERRTGGSGRAGRRITAQLYSSQATDGRYRNLDLNRPGIVIVHRASAKGLGFDIVVVPDTHTDAATDPAEAALRMTYYVLATRAREELHLGYDGEAEPPHLAGVPERLLRRG